MNDPLANEIPVGSAVAYMGTAYILTEMRTDERICLLNLRTGETKGVWHDVPLEVLDAVVHIRGARYPRQ